MTAGLKRPRGGIELGRRHDPDPGGEHLVGDEHDLRRVPGDLGGAPDEGALADHDRHVGLDAVFRADVYHDPLGELVPDRGYDPRQRPVPVDGALPLQEPAQPLVLLPQPGDLGGDLARLAQPPLQLLFVGRVYRALGAVPDAAQRLRHRGDGAAYGTQDLGGPKLHRVQRSALAAHRAVALFHVQGEEREADHAEDQERREAAGRA